MRKGMIGMEDVLASTQMKSPSSTKLPTKAPMTHGLLHGSSLPPRLSARSCTESAVTSSREPEMSTLAHIPFQRLSESTSAWLATTKNPTPNAIAETGTWSRKHQRHPMESAIKPPKDAPEIAPQPVQSLRQCSALRYSKRSLTYPRRYFEALDTCRVVERESCRS